MRRGVPPTTLMPSSPVLREPVRQVAPMQRPPCRARVLAGALSLCAATLAQEPRIHTDRPTGAQLLKLPKEDDAFGFVVFGDRTGGPPEGMKILEQAVADTNLL